MTPISRIEVSGMGKEVGGNRQLGTSTLIHGSWRMMRNKLGIDTDECEGAGQFGLWILEAALELENQYLFSWKWRTSPFSCRHSDPRRWPG